MQSQMRPDEATAPTSTWGLNHGRGGSGKKRTSFNSVFLNLLGALLAPPRPPEMNPKTVLLHTTPWPGTACLCLLPSSSCATPLAFGIDSLVRDPNHSFARAHGPILSRLPAERPKQCAHRNRFHLPLTDRLQATTGRLVVAQIILLRGHGEITRCHHRRNASIAPRITMDCWGILSSSQFLFHSILV